MKVLTSAFIFALIQAVILLGICIYNELPHSEHSTIVLVYGMTVQVIAYFGYSILDKLEKSK